LLNLVCEKENAKTATLIRTMKRKWVMTYFPLTYFPEYTLKKWWAV